MPVDKIAKIRQEIDKNDSVIIKTLAKRQILITKIAHFKDPKQIRDLEREKEIIANASSLAKKNNLDPKFIENLYKLILKQSKQEIKKLLQK